MSVAENLHELAMAHLKHRRSIEVTGDMVERAARAHYAYVTTDQHPDWYELPMVLREDRKRAIRQALLAALDSDADYLTCEHDWYRSVDAPPDTCLKCGATEDHG